MKYIQKDIFEDFEAGTINLILHQENCESTTYAGFAKIVHERYGVKSLNRFFSGIHFTVVKNKIVSAIINMYSQYYRGQPTNKKFKYVDWSYKTDNMETRLLALRNCLRLIKNTPAIDVYKIGMPLIASDLAADKKLKQNMTSLEYFKKYIAPIVEEELEGLDVTVYYL